MLLFWNQRGSRSRGNARTRVPRRSEPGARDSPSVSVQTSRRVLQAVKYLRFHSPVSAQVTPATCWRSARFFSCTYKAKTKEKVRSRRAPAQLQDHRLFAGRSIKVPPRGPMRPESEWAPAGTGTMVRPGPGVGVGLMASRRFMTRFSSKPREINILAATCLI